MRRMSNSLVVFSLFFLIASLFIKTNKTSWT